MELLKAPALQDAPAGRPEQVKITELSAKPVTVSEVEPEPPGEEIVTVVGFAVTATARLVCEAIINFPLT